MANYNKDKKHHFIYKTTNNLNGEYYIGMHSTNNIKDGYMGSGKRLRRSLNKYGKENFTFEIIEHLFSREDLVNRESEIVNEELISDKNCLNLRTGGTGGFSQEQQIINSKKAIIRKNEIKKSNPNWQKQLNEKTAEGLRRYYSKNNQKGFFRGKKHTIEAKHTIGLKNKVNQLGDKNSQFGTMWITNGIKNKKINNCSDLPIGWYRGRTMKKIKGN